MTAPAPSPKYFLVMALSPRGRFRRCEIQFDRAWRPIELGDRFDPNAMPPIVTIAELARIKAETAETQREYLEAYASIEPDPDLRKLREREASAATERRSPMLAMRPAEAVDIEKLLAELEAADMTPEKQLAAERARNAELERRLADVEAQLMTSKLSDKGGKKS